ncbi:MAG: hypothetical protein FWH05_03885 [Oscillospiraceae bacterium]|nr:hypothetical protein [Oscillospiraceae bacterium]
MKHLFIINPVARKVRGKLGALTERLDSFFKEYPAVNYQVHVTRWERDALGVIRRHAAESAELLRVHVMGGNTTVFEAINGVMGLPNTQLAIYPMGAQNSFLRYFGKNKIHLFLSLRSQVFSRTVPIDAFRCGNNYGILQATIGLEAKANFNGLKILEKRALPGELAYALGALGFIFKKEEFEHEYAIKIDDGEERAATYSSIMASNAPCSGKTLDPAPLAQPNNGFLDLQFLRNITRLNLVPTLFKYLFNKTQKIRPSKKCSSVFVSSTSSTSPLLVGVDGHIFYENNVELQVLPYAVDFVLPPGVKLFEGR